MNWLAPHCRVCLGILLALLLLPRFAAAAPPPPPATPDPAARASRTMPLNYPATQKVDHVDDYHGSKIADPYRWLEDLDSEATRSWVEAQNKVTFAWLERLPVREKLRTRLTELWNYERFTLPQKRGGRYFFTRNDGLQNQ